MLRDGCKAWRVVLSQPVHKLFSINPQFTHKIFTGIPGDCPWYRQQHNREKLMKRTMICLTVVFILSGCGQPVTPDQVASEYWEAIRENDNGKAQTLLASFVGGDFKPLEGAVEEVTFGPADISATGAAVPTRVITHRDGSLRVDEFTTWLLKRGDDWKVDIDQTMQSVIGSKMNDAMEIIGNAMSGIVEAGTRQVTKALDSVLSELDDALAEGAKVVAEEMKVLAEEMKEVEDSLQRDIEKSMRD